MPANTPRDAVLTIQRETAKALKLPDVVARLKTGGNEGVGNTPEEFDARFRADIVKFAKIIKDANIPTQVRGPRRQLSRSGQPPRRQSRLFALAAELVGRRVNIIFCGRQRGRDRRQGGDRRQSRSYFGLAAIRSR